MMFFKKNCIKQKDKKLYSSQVDSQKTSNLNTKNSKLSPYTIAINSINTIQIEVSPPKDIQLSEMDFTSLEQEEEATSNRSPLQNMANMHNLKLKDICCTVTDSGSPIETVVPFLTESVSGSDLLVRRQKKLGIIIPC